MPEPRKVVIVTGASQGIGAGVAAAFRRAGHAVVGTSRSIAPSDDADYLAVRGDITEVETAHRIVDEALRRFGRIDTLVNNAGLFIAKPFGEYSRVDYATITAVNLAGFFHVTQLVIEQMAAQGAGHVVNVTTSLVDHANGTSPSALVSLTKGGLSAATRALAIEYASRGVRVNAIAPGIIRTAEHAASSYDGLAETIPLRRLGEIDDVVEGILYLERATFVTGETLHVDGGWSAGH
jgi:NAD(P)-dependent dehydrogenase (short-subunit alcohol dehydrogenase family)